MDKELKRNEHIIMRLSADEKKQIMDEAEKRGLSISSYVRMVVLGAKKK